MHKREKMDETHDTYIHFGCSGMSWYIQECAESIQAYQLTDCDSMNERPSHIYEPGQ